VLWVVLGEDNIELFRSRTDAVELGTFDGRSTAEIEESRRLRADLIDALRQNGQSCLVPALDVQYGLAQFVLGMTVVTPEAAQLASRYVILGLPVAVFEVPPGAPGPERPADESCQ
jgi:hypothetical protein